MQINILDKENDAKTIHPSSGDLTYRTIKIKPIKRKNNFDAAIFFIFSIPSKYHKGEAP